MTGSSQLDYELSEGFTSSHSENTEEVNQYSLSYEMTMSIGFSFAGMDQTIGESYSHTVQTDIEDSYSKDVT